MYKRTLGRSLDGSVPHPVEAESSTSNYGSVPQPVNNCKPNKMFLFVFVVCFFKNKIGVFCCCCLDGNAPAVREASGQCKKKKIATYIIYI